MIITSQTYHPIGLISAPKIPTDLLWQLSYLFVVLAILYFIFVFFYRNRLSAKGENEKNRKRELSPMISEFLFHEAESTKEENTNYINLKIEIRQLLKDDFNRQIISEILLDLRKDVAGETQKRVFKLYQDLGLHKDAFEKLKSRRWEVVSKAILELTQMQVAEAYSFVTKFINDKRPTIRKQAEIAVVTLKPEGINYFLDTTKYKISEWQQLKILDVLRMEEDFLPPPFKAWLTSTNRHVVLFALRLIKYYNQNDAKQALIELVKHKNNQIKEEAIACIKEFHITEALDMLKLVFWKCSVDVKIAILDAIGFLGSDIDIEFLRSIGRKESNFSVKSKALSSINAIAPDSIMPSKDLLKATSYKIPADLIIKTTKNEEEEEERAKEKETTLISPEPISNDKNKITDEQSEPEITPLDNQQSKENQKEELEEVVITKELNHEFLPIVIQDDVVVPISEITKDIKEIEVHLTDDETLSDKIAANEQIFSDPEHVFSIEVQAEELAFLPIVTENIDSIQTNTSDKDLNEFETPIEDLKVIYEEVHVIENDYEEKNSEDYSEFNSSLILNQEVHFEEVMNKNDTSTTNTTNSSQKNSELEIDGILDDPSNTYEKIIQPSNSMSPKEEQILKNVIKELLGFDDQQEKKATVKSTQNFDAEFDEKTDVEKKEENVQLNIDFDEEQSHEITNSIPKAILGEEFQEEIFLHQEGSEESRNQLLDDISEMGDERELSLLRELLVDDKFKNEKNRIQEIINKFSNISESALADVTLNRFNVFEDLFRTCDTEAKLILMDEITAVGDKSDIEFLERLIKNEDGILEQKARATLHAVLTRLSLEYEQETESESANTIDSESDTSNSSISKKDKEEQYDALLQNLEIEPCNEEHDMFDLTFELTNPDEENLSHKYKTQLSLREQINFISNKIIDKLNG